MSLSSTGPITVASVLLLFSNKKCWKSWDHPTPPPPFVVSRPHSRCHSVFMNLATFTRNILWHFHFHGNLQSSEKSESFKGRVPALQSHKTKIFEFGISAFLCFFSRYWRRYNHKLISSYCWLHPDVISWYSTFCHQMKHSIFIGQTWSGMHIQRIFHDWKWLITECNKLLHCNSFLYFQAVTTEMARDNPSTDNWREWGGGCRLFPPILLSHSLPLSTLCA